MDAQAMRKVTVFVTAGLCLLALPVAQAQRSDAVHAVAYVDIAPTAIDQAQSAFNAYAQTSQKEAGFGNLMLLQELDRPGRWLILESWSDQSAWNTHADSNTVWQHALQTLRLGSYDQRPYRSLPDEGTLTNEHNAVYVMTHVDVAGPQAANAPALLQQHCRTVRTEAGNLRCAVWQGAQRSNHFTLIAVWINRAALNTHQTASSTRAFRDEIEPMTGSPMDERWYQQR
jgi:quinol monooxygenase YgiN